MSEVKQISYPTVGVLGDLHTIEFDKNSMLVFQLPRASNMISDSYLNSIKSYITPMLPAGSSVLMIGCDVNIYEMASEEAISLKLKGLI